MTRHSAGNAACVAAGPDPDAGVLTDGEGPRERRSRIFPPGIKAGMSSAVAGSTEKILTEDRADAASSADGYQLRNGWYCARRRRGRLSSNSPAQVTAR
jgi:hypothetical protein